MIKKKTRLKPLFKHQIIITAVSVFAVIIVAIAISYAAFSKGIKSEEYNVIKSGDLEISYVDNQTEGNILKLVSKYPITDEEGRQGTAYRFSVENTGTIKEVYRIKIVQDDEVVASDNCGDRTLDLANIKYMFDNQDPKLLTEAYTDLGYYLHESSLEVGESSIHEIRIWLKEDAGNDVLGKHFHGKIMVELEQDRPISAVTAIMKNPVQTTYTLITTSKEANENGLFKSTDTNDGSPTYFFRGAVENNYLKFANLDWRIIRINEDGTIRIRLANGINNDQRYQFNSVYNTYDKMYYTNSTLKPIVDNWYQEEIGNNPEYASKVVQGNYFCEQAKVKYIDSYTSGNATMTLYTSYTPNFKCATDGNGKGLVNSAVGLITYDELIHAGGYIYPKIDDTFYLYRAGKYDWSMSPAAFRSTYTIAWRLIDGYVNDYSVNGNFGVLPVLNLSADVLATGTGTSTDPFVVR